MSRIMPTVATFVGSWTVAQLVSWCASEGLDPETVTVVYAGCGTHEVTLRVEDPS